MKTTLVQSCLLLQPWMHAVSSEGAVCQEHGLQCRGSCISQPLMQVGTQGSTPTCTADRHKLVPGCMVVQRLQGLLNLVQPVQPPLQVQHVHGCAGGCRCGCKYHPVLCSTCSGSKNIDCSTAAPRGGNRYQSVLCSPCSGAAHSSAAGVRLQMLPLLGGSRNSWSSAASTVRQHTAVAATNGWLHCCQADLGWQQTPLCPLQHLTWGTTACGSCRKP